MKNPFVNYLLRGLVGGLLFAIIMWLYDNSAGVPFDLSKFIFRMLFYGIIMGIIWYFLDKNRRKKINSTPNEPGSN